jgi:hypothetical protein
VSLYAEQELKSLRRRIRKYRVLRVAATAAVVANVVTFAMNLAIGSLVAILPAVLVIAAVLMAMWETRLISGQRQREAELLRETHPRPDYAAIAAMELEIWGRAFEHEGAPAATRTPRRYTTWNEDGERFCPWCPDEGCCKTCGFRRNPPGGAP